MISISRPILRSIANNELKRLGFYRQFSSGKVKRERPTKDVLDIIICPLSHGELFYWEKTHELISLTAQVAYPVYDNGIVNLCPYDARVLGRDEQFEMRKS